MTAKTTMDRVYALIESRLTVPPSQVQPESKFIDLGADSLDCVEIAVAIEEEFGVDLPDDEIPKMETVADLIASIDKAAANV